MNNLSSHCLRSDSPKMSPKCGFSLVEMMVAISIVALLVMMLGGVSAQVLKMTSSSQTKSSNMKQTRLLMMLITRDIEAAIINNDLAKFVDDKGKNALQFYSRVKSPEDSGVKGEGRSLSLLSYRLEEDKIYRWSMAIGWDNRDRLRFSVKDTLPAFPEEARDLICSGILSFHWAFLCESGITEEYKTQPRSKALRISVIVVEESMRNKLEVTGKWETLKETFDRVTRNHFESSDLQRLTLKAEWEKELEKPEFLRKFPEGLGKSISFTERFIELPPQLN